MTPMTLWFVVTLIVHIPWANVRIDVANVAKMPQLCSALSHVRYHLDFVRTDLVENHDA